jgi:hypothetical protein
MADRKARKEYTPVKKNLTDPSGLRECSWQQIVGCHAKRSAARVAYEFVIRKIRINRNAAILKSRLGEVLPPAGRHPLCDIKRTESPPLHALSL